MQTLNAFQNPGSDHGKTFRVFFTGEKPSGEVISGNYGYCFNGYEFDNPLSQGFFEAQNICINNGLRPTRIASINFHN